MRIEDGLTDKNNPLVGFFALNNKWDLDGLWREIISYPLCHVCQFWTDDTENIRMYFGEATAFYLAFVSYLTISIIPVSMIAVSLYAVHLVTQSTLLYAWGSLGM